jgi:hypothetical protein
LNNIKGEKAMKCFEAKKVQRSHTIKLLAPPERVFPLLCPVREEEWIPGWENETYELIYSKSGYNEEGCIFKTSFNLPTDSIWTCLKFDPTDYEVEFIVHIIGREMRKFKISLEQNNDNSTNAQFVMTITALCESGNEFVENFTEEEYIKFISRFELMLNYYFQHGKKLAITTV